MICGVLVLLSLASGAQARTWEALYAFGDSYTDSGAGYLDADGPTAVVYLASSLGIPSTTVHRIVARELEREFTQAFP
ncbi:MAG: hypothetical protein ACHQIL_01405 [Steroidobacterales bacterium]